MWGNCSITKHGTVDALVTNLIHFLLLLFYVFPSCLQTLGIVEYFLRLVPKLVKNLLQCEVVLCCLKDKLTHNADTRDILAIVSLAFPSSAWA